MIRQKGKREKRGKRKYSKKPVFNGKDWKEILNRMIMNLGISMLTQALKKGTNLKYVVNENDSFYTPEGVTTKTRNPGRKGGYKEADYISRGGK